MRVLHIDTGREMGGGQWQVLRLIEGLAAEGVSSTLLAPADVPLANRARRVCAVHPPTLWNLATRRADLVHAHDARGHTLAMLTARHPLVVARRVVFPIRSRWKYRRAARYIAVSEAVKRVLTEAGVPANKIEVIYDGVPLLEPSGGGTLILAPSKCAAFAALAGLPVHFASDLEAALPQAAVLVYLTESEGLGSGVLLAMSAGVPVIASNVGGLPEIVRHEETGLLVPNTAAGVAAAIRRLQEDPALARRLAERARREIAERFSTPVMVRRTLEVYRQVLS